MDGHDYGERIERAIEDPVELKRLAEALETDASIEEGEREFLLGMVDRYMSDLDLEAEGIVIAGFDDDVARRAVEV